jgi:hypothetical protein
MQNDHNTLSDYFSLLTDHTENVAKFNCDTNDWLSNHTAADLFFEDAANRIVRETMELWQNKLSIQQKILIVIQELAKDSKTYLDRLVRISGILGALITHFEDISGVNQDGE